MNVLRGQVADRYGWRPGSIVGARAEAWPPAGNDKKVLAVNENRNAAAALALLLHGQGLEARAAHKGGGALEAAWQFRPDVAVVDSGLSGIDGFEVARQLRKLPPDISDIVALSGWKIETGEPPAKHFDHFFTEPSDPREPERLISSL